MDDRGQSGLKKWVWAGAVYNLLISLPLVLPNVFEQSYRFMNSVTDAFNLGGERAVPPDEGVNRLFVNFAAVLLVFLALLLVYASRDLEHRLGIVFLNAAARIVSIAYFVYYVLAEDAPRAMLGFSVGDLALAVAFLYYIRRIRGLSPRTWLA
jgi:hypothetical protein